MSTTTGGAASDRGPSWLSAGAAMGTLGAVASLAPSLYPRGVVPSDATFKGILLAKAQQPAITLIVAGAAFGLGVGVNALADAVDDHTGADALGSRLVLGGGATVGAVGAALALRGKDPLSAMHAIPTALGVVAGTSLLGAGLIGEQALAEQIAPGGGTALAGAHLALLGGATVAAGALLLGVPRASAVSVADAARYTAGLAQDVPSPDVAFDAALYDRLTAARAKLTTVVGFGTHPVPAQAPPGATLTPAGLRFTGEAVPASIIDEVMPKLDGVTTKDPVRVFSGVDHTATIDERVERTFQETERLGGFANGHVVLYAPTGSGYIYPETVAGTELMTRGNVTSVAMQWNHEPSAKSFDEAPFGTRLFDATIKRFADHIATLPEGERPKLVISGESLGAKALHDVFAGRPASYVAERGVDSIITVGNSRNGALRVQHLGTGGWSFDGTGTVVEFDDPRAFAKLPPEVRDGARVLLNTHHNDPAGKFTPQLMWQRPEWLADREHGTGVPRRMKWMPFVTGLQGGLDMYNGSNLRPGDFTRTGHDYRADMWHNAALALRMTPSDAETAAAAPLLHQIELARRERPISGEI